MIQHKDTFYFGVLIGVILFAVQALILTAIGALWPLFITGPVGSTVALLLGNKIERKGNKIITTEEK